MQLLLIKLASLDANPVYALLGKKQKEDRFTPGDWKKVRAMVRGRKVVLLLPNHDITLSTVNIPSKNKKQLAQAVPYALEESLAEDIEDLHFTIHALKPEKTQKDNNGSDENTHGDNTGNHTNLVAIINRTRLSDYLDALSSHHIPVHYVLPQLFTLEYHPNCWTILGEEAHASSATSSHTQVRLSALYGFSCPQDMLDVFLPEQLEKQIPEAIYSNLSSDQLPESLGDIPLKQSADPALVKQASILAALPLNLLSGFIRKRKASRFNFKPWKPVFALGGLIAAIWLGILGWQNIMLGKQLEQLDTAIIKVYKSTFPDGRIVDPPQQMASKLKALEAGKTKTVGTPLPLIATVGPLLKTHKTMTLHEIRYQDNELRLIVRAPDLNSLENFKREAAKQAHLDVAIKSSTTTADKVEATLVIKAADGFSLEQSKAASEIKS